MKQVLFIIIMSLLISCNSSEKTAVDEQQLQNYMQKGDSITMATQKELLKNVSSAMQSGGPAHAIDFCNTRAMKLTDSLSEKYNCTIERLSLQNRNPNNSPDSNEEKEQLKLYENQHKDGKDIEPTVHSSKEKVVYYKPITVGMETCLKCHGTPENGLSEEVMTQLAELYPNDNATGYELHDFRGMWKVTFSEP